MKSILLVVLTIAALDLAGCGSNGSYQETRLPPESVQKQVDGLPSQVKNNPNINQGTKEMLTHAIPMPAGRRG